MKLAIRLPLASLTSLRGIPDDLDTGVLVTHSIISDARWMYDTLRMIDNG